MLVPILFTETNTGKAMNNVDIKGYLLLAGKLLMSSATDDSIE